MYLNQAQQHMYQDDGFLFFPACFSQAEVDRVKAELPALFAQDSPARVLEQDGQVVRSVYGSHTTNEMAHRLACHPRLVEPAMQLLGGKVYIYQFKINAKAAFGGDVWEWHQDYIFWHKEDGMSTARVINALVFLDDVNEANGPLMLLAGSHKEGMIEVSPRNTLLTTAYQTSPAWIANVTANLKYSLDATTLAALTEKYKLVAPQGPAGSLLLFHGNLVHGSAANRSPLDRNVAIITFNHIENVPIAVKEPRPNFLASRDTTAVEPLEDSVLCS